MTKFCAECGNRLSDSVRFCGSCGTAVQNLCPTCGQEWNQTQAKPNQPATTTKKVAEPAITTAITSAHVQPIYGAAYEPTKDCPNCGAKGMGKKTCSTCESEN